MREPSHGVALPQVCLYENEAVFPPINFVTDDKCRGSENPLIQAQLCLVNDGLTDRL